MFPRTDACETLRIKISNQKEEIKNYAKQLARGLIDEDLFEELTLESKEELFRLEKQLESTEEIKDNNAYGKVNILRSIQVLEEIITKNELTNTDVTMLISKIAVKESDEVGKYNTPKLDIEIHWNAPFVDLQELV